MAFVNRIDIGLPRTHGPLVLCDRLLTLSEDLKQAGFQVAAEHLAHLAIRIVDDPPSLRD